MLRSLSEEGVGQPAHSRSAAGILEGAASLDIGVAVPQKVRYRGSRGPSHCREKKEAPCPRGNKRPPTRKWKASVRQPQRGRKFSARCHMEGRQGHAGARSQLQRAPVGRPLHTGHPEELGTEAGRWVLVGGCGGGRRLLMHVGFLLGGNDNLPPYTSVSLSVKWAT